MPKLMPQEIEVWYLLPAIRKELAKILIADYKLPQKEIAKILGITEPAVSQYLKSKRGHEMVFSDAELKKIKDAASMIVKDPQNVLKYLYDLSVVLRGSKGLCDVHKKHEKNIPPNCKVCMSSGT